MNNEVYESITSRLPLKKRTRREIDRELFVYPKSTKREDIIDWLIHTQFVDFYSIKLSSNDDTSIDDVIQDVYLDILEMSQEDWDRLTKQGFGAIRAYVSGMIHRQVCSSTSPSYYKYRRYNQHRTSIEDQNKLTDIDED